MFKSWKKWAGGILVEAGLITLLPAWACIVTGLLLLVWAEVDNPWVRRRFPRLTRPMQRRPLVPIDVGWLERMGSTSTYKTAEDVTALLSSSGDPHAERAEAVKNEIGSFTPTEICALRTIRTFGELGEQALKTKVIAAGFQWDPAIPSRLQNLLVTHDFRGNFSIVPKLKDDVDKLFGD